MLNYISLFFARWKPKSISCLILIASVSLFNQIHAEDNSTQKQHFQSPQLQKGVLLIADKKLADPNFEKTVVLITEYNNDGTSGLILNRSTKLPVAEVLPQIPQLQSLLEHLYIGGPVLPNAVNLLVMSEQVIMDGNNIIDDVYLVNTLELLGEIFERNIETKHVRLYSGFAGWAPGQLETELMRGDWHIWYASGEIIFSDAPESVWDEMIQIVTAKWVMNQYPLY